MVFSSRSLTIGSDVGAADVCGYPKSHPPRLNVVDYLPSNRERGLASFHTQNDGYTRHQSQVAERQA